MEAKTAFPLYRKANGEISGKASISVGNLFRAFRKTLKPEVYPLLVCMGGALCLASYYSAKHIMYSPVAQFSQRRKKQVMMHTVEDGERWVKHHKTWSNMLGSRYVSYPKSTLAKAE